MRIAAAVLFCLGLVLPAEAAQVSAFTRASNDGVYSLNQRQKNFFGVKNADYIAFVHVRAPQGGRFFAGDTFDATTAANSVASNGSAILAFLNGTNNRLNYTGNAFGRLGLTTFARNGPSFADGYAFLFSANAGSIRLQGNANFDASQSLGVLDFTPATVPLPAALPLLGVALGILGAGAARRRRARRT
ncbi:hypothetical protein DEA8626_00217 [Defluviimonas aquaemixtae]|uniref:VPLPA-CTERM protein sorting domain-containing protein n=1 Tax=Albidovulum aquaemixtae TaxID=1542388 RepID=A0A2R8B241_9RHOB|nr:hypothetical protein [Defluviimonas aquaemixtae]SPH16706.1 hypothetical protein DEA8626_00217 [Defluviimonas aquaemixtae]